MPTAVKHRLHCSGSIAQLGERPPHTREVTGSSPVAPMAHTLYVCAIFLFLIFYVKSYNENVYAYILYI